MYVMCVCALYMFAYGDCTCLDVCVVCVHVCIWRLYMFECVHCVYVLIYMSVCPLCMCLCVGTVHVRIGCVCPLCLFMCGDCVLGYVSCMFVCMYILSVL